MKLSKLIPPLIPLVVVVVGLEFLVRESILPAYLVPTPSGVFKILIEFDSDIWGAFLQTTWMSALGLVLSIAGGLGLGILFSSSEWVRKSLMPYAVFFQTVPIVAVAPLLVIWIGYGAPTVITSALIVSIFPVIASTLTGLQSTDPLLVDLFKLYRAGASTTLWKLRLPYALPQIFVGFRIAAGLSVVGAVVGEFIAGGGLGGLVDVARTQQRVDRVFAAIILGAAIALIFIQAINLGARLTLKKWHVSER